LIRQDPNLDFNWILDSPAPGIPADNFSVRWTRLFNFTESGDYRFFADVDDGVRLYVDGRQLIDAWNTEPPIIHFGDVGSLQPGVHTITVEYFESGGHARARVWTERVDLSSNNWRAAYFNNGNWQEPPILVRQDSEIDFDWGNDSPTGALNDNNFTVRWTGRFFFDPGDYRFFADVAGKDQVKIYLDGWLLADDYRDNAGRVEGVFADVGPGNHTITIEYREDGGRSRIKVGWERE
ncbi:MAG: PA14 domain-containing protein, partial [Anaerolineae bacterium]|nr:PA14 domain-containing protein [Anaerolineae bacterium]